MSIASPVGDKTLQFPKTFVLELTRRCNNYCQYCYTVWGAPELRYERNPGREASAADICAMISKLQDEVSVESIGISGGEPFLREDLQQILSFIDRRGIGSVLITNGTLLSSERINATMVCGSYEVPLLSYRREVHDRLVGRRGAHDAVVQGMANIRRAGGKVIAVFIATKVNWMDLYKTVELAIALGADALMYNRINLGAQNIRHADQLLPTPEMLRENLDRLEELGGKYGLPITPSVVIEPCVVDVSNYKNIHFGWCPQAGADSYFTIDPVGNIRICNHSPVILGNLHRDHFANIYLNHPHVRNFRSTLPTECLTCEHELKAVCGGGCKAAAEQCYGTLTRVDPFVTLSQA